MSKALVIDDSRAIRLILSRTLSQLGYEVHQAANGRDHFGVGNKFITPMIADGKVFVGTTSGVGVFGLLK